MYCVKFFIILFELYVAVKAYGKYITEPPPSTEHPLVKNVKIKMVTKNQGFFTAFVQELCAIIAVKKPLQFEELYRAFDRAISNMMSRQSRFEGLDIRFEADLIFMLQRLTALEPDVIQSYASTALSSFEEKDESLVADVHSLLKDLDDIYSFKDGEELLNTLVQVDEYPKKDSALVVAENVVEKVFSPYFKIAALQKGEFLIQSIYNVVEKRNLGRVRRMEELDERMSEKGYEKENNAGFDEVIFRKDEKNGQITTSLTKINAKERNDLIVKELIENVKVMEAIKKYENKKVQTPVKSSTDFYRRVYFNEIHPVTNENSTSINFDDKKIKIISLDDGNIKYKFRTEEDAKMKRHKKSRNHFYLKMGIDTDRLSGSTSENKSESGSRNGRKSKRTSISELKTHRKQTKHKTRNHSLRKHAKRRHERNRRRRMNAKNKVKRKHKKQKRFNKLKKLHRQPSVDDKTRATDNESPSYDLQYSNEENRSLSDNSKEQPPETNRRTPDDIIRDVDAHRLPSVYLTNPTK